MIGITGATGQLGQLVVKALLEKGIDAAGVVAMGRNQDKLNDLSTLGVQTRIADYADASTLADALTGVTTLLLISSNEIGQRSVQHKAVIEAAEEAGVQHIAYTSLLGADTAQMALAGEHLETEHALAESALDATILRNGWYSENYAGAIPQAVQMGQLFGAAQDGRVSAAARQDYAEAAATVLSDPAAHAGTIYELAGDDGFSYTELAGEIASASGKDVTYVDLPEAAYADALAQAGLPQVYAEIFANSDVGLARGELYSDRKDLSELIGRATTPIAQTVSEFI